MGKSCGRFGEKIGAYRVLVRKSKMKKQLGRPRTMWTSKINMDI
jgi:hypothetical protein